MTDNSETGPASNWPGFPGWRYETPPLAPCRRPGCRGVVRWQGFDFGHFGSAETQPLFCSEDCESRFWTEHDGWREDLRYFIDSRRDNPDFWRDKERVWQEQFDLVWWHLARYMGVRRYATDPHRAKWHEHYYAVGKMIARAGEAEACLESMTAELMGVPQSTYRGDGARTLETLRRNAERWPHLADRIIEMTIAGQEAQTWRNRLVHSYVVPSWDGSSSQLQKPQRGQDRWELHAVSVDQIERLAARFVWVEDATMRILNDMDPEEPGAANADPLGPPPPLDFHWPPRDEDPSH